MTLTAAQVKSFEKALGAVNAVLPKLQFLVKLSEADPLLAERLEPLLSQSEFLRTLATLAIELDTAERSEGE